MEGMNIALKNIKMLKTENHYYLILITVYK